MTNGTRGAQAVETQSDERIWIAPGLSIPSSEVQFRFSRSGGPGGQHVNRTETRVELLFDLAHSPSLTDEQRQLAAGRLGARLDSDGVLHVVSSLTRSQLDNRADALARFVRLLRSALRRPTRRVATRPTRAAREARLQGKRRQSQRKQLRRSPPPTDG